MRPSPLSRDLIKEFLSYIQVEKGCRLTHYRVMRGTLRVSTMGAQERYPSAEFTQTGFASLDRGPFARRSRAFFSGQGGQRRPRFFRFLMLDGHIKRHPTEELDTPQRFAYLPQFLTEEEIDKLFAAPDISTRKVYGSSAAGGYVWSRVARF